MIQKKYIGLITWILSLIVVGFLLGKLTGNHVNSWYLTLNRSLLSPPDYVFGYVWTILYTMIAIAGWIIWNTENIEDINSIKKHFAIQLILNWAWSPLFFGFHQAGAALICLAGILITTALLIRKTFRQLKTVSFLLAPYLGWLFFAAYLNWYIWIQN